MPRIPPIATKDQLQPEHQYVFDQVMDVFGRVRGPFSMLLHSPKLAERLLPMVPFAREGTVIDPKLRQIAVLAAVRSATLIGVDGQPVTVEVHVSSGLPAYQIVGLPDAAVRESRERVRAAVLSSGQIGRAHV